MLKVAMSEYINDLRKTIRWWKIAIFLLVSVMFFFVFQDYREFSLWRFYTTVWLIQAMKPKVSRLNYLLPGDTQSRSHYLFYSAISIALLFILWYGIVHSINVICGNYNILHAVKNLFGIDLLIILMSVSWVTQTCFLSKVPHTKTKKSILVLMYVPLLYPAIFLAALVYWIKGFWFLPSSAFAYLCIIPICFHSFKDLKNFDTSYENIRKPVRFSI